MPLYGTSDVRDPVFRIRKNIFITRYDLSRNIGNNGILGLGKCDSR
jgi:hypothetical protein